MAQVPNGARLKHLLIREARSEAERLAAGRSGVRLFAMVLKSDGTLLQYLPTVLGRLARRTTAAKLQADINAGAAIASVLAHLDWARGGRTARVRLKLFELGAPSGRPLAMGCDPGAAFGLGEDADAFPQEG